MIPDDSSEGYVLITPARNEEAFIEATIKAVINQTLLAQEWVIVSDGWCDRTDEIVEDYASRYNFIKFLRGSGNGERNFGSKVNAFNLWLGGVRVERFEYIGNLDQEKMNFLEVHE